MARAEKRFKRAKSALAEERFPCAKSALVEGLFPWADETLAEVRSPCVESALAEGRFSCAKSALAEGRFKCADAGSARTTPTAKPMQKPVTVPESAIKSVVPVALSNHKPYRSIMKKTQSQKLRCNVHLSW